MPSESVKSGRMSGKYRVKSRTSQVDETLFSSNVRLMNNYSNGCVQILTTHAALVWDTFLKIFLVSRF